MAAPDKTVIVTLGDGAYLFNVPSACHWVAQACELPIVVVLFTNQGWRAVKFLPWTFTRTGMPYRMNVPDLQPRPRAGVSQDWQAFGDHGEMVNQADEVMSALRRASKIRHEEKRVALLKAVCKRI